MTSANSTTRPALRMRTAHVGVVSQRSGLDLIDDLDCLDNVAVQSRLGRFHTVTRLVAARGVGIGPAGTRGTSPTDVRPHSREESASGLPWPPPSLTARDS